MDTLGPGPVVPPQTTAHSDLTVPTWQRRVVALGEVVLCSSVPTQLAIGATLATLGLAPLDGAGDLSLPFVLVLSLVDSALLIFFMLWLLRAEGESPRTLWLGTRPPLTEARFGLLLVPGLVVGVSALLNGIRLIAPALQNVQRNPLEQLATSPGNAALLALVAIVAGGVREELQRAFLLRRFEQYLGGAPLGMVLLSVAFGLGHYVQGWDAVVATAALGVVWAWVYLRRRSAVAPVISHATFNSLEIVRVALIGP